MLVKVIVSIVVPIVLGALWAYLTRVAARRTELNEDGSLMLEIVPALRRLVAACLALLGGFLLFACVYDPAAVRRSAGSFALVAMLVFVLGPFALYHLTARVLVTDEGIERTTFLGVRKLAWRDIESVRWTEAWSSLRFDGMGRKLLVCVWVRGIDEFETVCRAKLGDAAVDEAFRRARKREAS